MAKRHRSRLTRCHGDLSATERLTTAPGDRRERRTRMKKLTLLAILTTLALTGCATGLIHADPADLAQARDIYAAAGNVNGVACTNARLANIGALNAIAAPLPKTAGFYAKEAAVIVKADAIAAGEPQAVRDACAALRLYELSWWRRVFGRGM